MANHVLLNNVEHADLRVNTDRAVRFGDDVMCALTFPAEFRNVQAEYPIFFYKNLDTGQFQALAMFGFEDQENLFLDGEGWQANYIPLSVLRQPFLIGYHEDSSGGEVARHEVVHLDLDHPRVGSSEGEALFQEHGGTTPFLDNISALLHTMHKGFEGEAPFMDRLVKYELLELFDLDVTLDDGSEHRLAGYYTINEEKLNELPGDVLQDLNRRGFLQAIYMVIASLSNIRVLIEKRNARLASEAQA
jgi:hypothetical protein